MTVMDDFPRAPDRLATLANCAVQRLGLSQRPPVDPDGRHRGLGPCDAA
jgi:hypothetical protein